MGEIAQPNGGEISMAALLEICTALDIEPQAVRTAMSRLSKDGLVVGKRVGRTAYYRFSVQGLIEYQVAESVIYAAPRKIDDWTFAFASDGRSVNEVQQQFEANPPLVLGGRCYVWPTDVWAQISQNGASDLMIFDARPRDMPTWARNTILPALNFETCRLISEGCRTLTDFELTLNQAIFSRVLLIHFWRRLVLRYPSIEAPIVDWQFSQVHRDIAAIYPQLLNSSSTTQAAKARFQ
jgi:phenylacetic acid degradation operon negative regulatory protein